MRRKSRRTKSVRSKIKLGLPELEYVKTSVINSLRSLESQRSYQHSINEFVSIGIVLRPAFRSTKQW
jgi:hypothetical protein